jgi:hypothetical protein
MRETSKAMSAFNANPTVYLAPAIILAAVALYYLYGAIDRLGLESQTLDAVVTAKQVAPGTTTSWTNIAGGRAWMQSQQNPESYVLSLAVGPVQTIGLVAQPLFDSLRTGDHVRATIRRTRLSHNLEVIEVSR